MKKFQISNFLILTIITGVLVCSNYSTTAQQLEFYPVNPVDGPSLGRINDISMDSAGYMWFATDAGLVQFDGFHFKFYNYDPDNTHSIIYDLVNNLFVDAHGMIWIGTKGRGADVFDPASQKFKHYIFDSNSPVTRPKYRIKDILEDKRGNIWIGTDGGGLFKVPVFDRDSVVHYKSNVDNPNSLQNMGVTALMLDDDGKVWVGTWDGSIQKYKEEEDHFELVDFPGTENINYLWDLFQDQQGNVWVGTWNDGLYRLKPDEEVVEKLLPNEDADIGVVIDICDDKDGNIWFAAFNDGLFKYSYKTGDFSFNIIANEGPQSIKEDNVMSVFAFKNTLWLGSQALGVYKANLKGFDFNHVLYNPESKHGLSHPAVQTIFKTAEETLILGARSNGINIQTKNSEKYKHLLPSKSPFQETNEYWDQITFIKSADANKLYIGTVGPLLKWDVANKNFSVVDFSNVEKVIPGEVRFIRTIYEDAFNNEWFGSYDDGLFIHNNSNGKFVKVNFVRDDGAFNDMLNEFTAITEDNDGNLLIATRRAGLIKIPSEVLPQIQQSGNGFKSGIDVDFTHWHNVPGDKNSLSNNYINCMFRDSYGHIWVGTMGGLNKYVSDSTFIRYDKKSGLSSNIINSIVEDDSGNLWIGTHYGLNKLSIVNDEISVFNKDNGLRITQFLKNAVFKDDDGVLYFGGEGGYIAFNPEKINITTIDPNLVFTDFLIRNESVDINDDGPLNKHISYMDNIILDHDQAYFSIDYLPLNPTHPQFISCEYKLEGFDQQWINDGANSIATYTNVPPGEYKFVVRVNDFGSGKKIEHSINITIEPPFYQLPAFRYLAIFTMIALVLGVIQWRTHSTRKMNKKLEKEVKIRTKELEEKSRQLHIQNDEIQAQNEEIRAQSDQLMVQNERLTETQKELLEAQKELKLINESLDRKVKERTTHLEKVIKELDMFVYSASHDLGAPLKSLLGLVRLTREEITEMRLKENFEHMEKSILKLENVITALKQFSRNNSVNVKKERIVLYDLMNNLLYELQHLDNYDKINFGFEGLRNHQVVSDQVRLRSAIQNLLENAIKYQDTSKPKSFIKFEFELLEQNWELKISDNGIGIDKKILNKVFDMFYRGTEQSTGSGLGLFIVKESLAMIDAEIKVDTEPGVGTTFIIKHPVLKAS